MKKANLLFRYGLVSFIGIFGFFAGILIYDVHSVRQPVKNIFLEKASQSMKDAYGQISGGVSDIQNSTSKLNNMNTSLGGTIKEIEEKINQFKI